MKINAIARKVLLVILAVFALQGVTEAQNLRVGGLVVNGSGEPMPFVNVALMRASDTVFMRGATTGIDGRFAIEAADTGAYLLQASFVGYQTFIKDLKDLNEFGDIRIEMIQGTILETVEVSAERPLYSMDGEKNLYNTKEDPSIQTGTASDALQNAPGVEVDAEGNITLRGVSSVEIWINDRPSHMNEEALKQYIKTMPANAIERIEVITNPSARYSTSGGVINIVTNQKVTRNELLCVGVRGSTTPSISPWISYVWANEKVDFNLYVNASYGYSEMAGDGTATLFDDNGDTSRYQSYKESSINHYIGGYTGINFNWNIDSMTNLVSWAGVYPYWGHGTEDASYRYLEYQPALTDLSYSATNGGDGFGWGGYLGTWFEHRFNNEGRKLSISLNGNTWSQGNNQSYVWDYSDPARADIDRRDSSVNTNPSVSLEVNYTHPLKHDITIEAGAEVETGGGHQLQRLDVLNTGTGQYDNVVLRSSEGFERGSGLNGYVTAQKRWGGFTAKLGLRAEQTWKYSLWNYLDGSGTTVVDTTFFSLVPSIHLSYMTPTFSNFSLSYTRRSSHPGMTQLSPFKNYSDYSYSTGNPTLLSTYTHNVEAAWSKYFMKFGSVGLNAYFRANNNEIGTMTAAAYDPYFGSLLVNYTYPDNIGSSHTEGLEANITYRPTGFVNVRLNASLFNYGYNYNDFSDSKLSYSFRLNVWTKVWNRLELFANARYSSPTLSLYSISNANKSVDFGVSSDFFDRKLSLNLVVNDILGWSEWGSNTTAPSYQTTGSQRFNSRFVAFGLTWRMGKMELESKARQGSTDTGSTPMM